MKLILSILLLAGYCCKSNKVVPIIDNKGIVYFSADNGANWMNKSKGLPDSIFLTDIAASATLLGVATKRHGIFLFDFQNEVWVKTVATPQTSDNLDALYFHHDKIFTGTQRDGIFVSKDKGRTWTQYNDGLVDLTIRKFAVIDNTLYVGTNGGLYSLNEKQNKWISEYGQSPLQVNGIIEFDNEIYIGTNQGAFKTVQRQSDWIQIMKNRSLHNISVAGKMVYALAYNELFASADKGNSWHSEQMGMPEGKYSFQLLQKDNVVLVGQWDGIYRNDSLKNWTAANNGLPKRFAVTEMKPYKDLVVIASSGWSNN
jgi:photosystem II stability/assembly factor-like uncharacterized protein